MKTQMLAILTLVLLGFTSVNASNLKAVNPLNDHDTTIECIAYTDANGLLTVRMYKETNAVVKISLYDASNNLVSYRSYKKVHNLKIQYDLSNNQSGAYTVKVKSGGDLIYTATVLNYGDQVAVR